MRRLALITVLGALLAGCGGEETVAPAPDTVEGTPPAAPQPTAGDPNAGKTLFAEGGCGVCHTFEPAGSSGTIGPNLAEVETHAEEANKPLDEYVRESLVSPEEYVVPGFQPSMPPYDGTQQEVADLVAFLTDES